MRLFNINGALGGVQAGYNWQVNQNWLLGVETDFDWSQTQGKRTSTFNLAGAPSSNFTASADVTSFGTVRARFGYLPTNSLLLFGTAGFAYGHVNEKGALNASSPLGAAVAGGFGFFVPVVRIVLWAVRRPLRWVSDGGRRRGRGCPPGLCRRPSASQARAIAIRPTATSPAETATRPGRFARARRLTMCVKWNPFIAYRSVIR